MDLFDAIATTNPVGDDDVVRIIEAATRGPVTGKQPACVLGRGPRGQKVDNRSTLAVPEAGKPQALEVLQQLFELRPHFEWWGLGLISQSASQPRDDLAAFDADFRLEVPGLRIADPKAWRRGEASKGVITLAVPTRWHRRSTDAGARR